MPSILYDVAVSADGFISGAGGDVSDFPHEGPVVEDYLDRLKGYGRQTRLSRDSQTEQRRQPHPGKDNPSCGSRGGVGRIGGGTVGGGGHFRLAEWRLR